MENKLDLALILIMIEELKHQVSCEKQALSGSNKQEFFDGKLEGINETMDIIKEHLT